MEKQKLERIGQLSRKQRSVGLTEEEKKEQAALRQEYLAAIRQDLTGTLDNTYVVDPNGNKKKIQRRD